MATGEISVRAAVPADTSAVDALLARTYPALLKADYPPSILVTVLPIISRARPELMACGTYYLAEDETGAVVGAGGWTPRAGPVAQAEIRHVVTDQRHLRRGIARMVFDRIFEMAGAAGMQGYHCLSTRTAVPFYRALGFREMGGMDVTLRPGISFPAVEMLRDA